MPTRLRVIETEKEREKITVFDFALLSLRLWRLYADAHTLLVPVTGNETHTLTLLCLQAPQCGVQQHGEEGEGKVHRLEAGQQVQHLLRLARVVKEPLLAVDRQWHSASPSLRPDVVWLLHARAQTPRCKLGEEEREGGIEGRGREKD